MRKNSVKRRAFNDFHGASPRGAGEVELANYYDENKPIKIALDPALTPNQNAQKYFQRYQKLKNAVKLIHQQIAETKDEIAYLESVEAQLEIAAPKDLLTIREELAAQGYVKNRTKQRKNKRPRNRNVFLF